MVRSAYGDDSSLDLAPGLGPVRYDPQSHVRQLLVAGTLFGIIGLTNIVQGVGALSGSSVYPANAVFVFGNARLWGGIVLAAGLLQLVVSFAIFTSQRWARVTGIVIGVANAFTHLFVLSAHPWWAVVGLALDVIAVRALVVHGGQEILD